MSRERDLRILSFGLRMTSIKPRDLGEFFIVTLFSAKG